MPPYCIVCNQDLALDRTAEPPLCGRHASESVQKRARETELQNLINLRISVLHLDTGPHYVTKHPGGSKECTIIVDEYDSTGRFVQRPVAKVERFTYMTTYGKYSQKQSIWFCTEADNCLRTLLDAHRQLVKSGWRAYPGPIRYQTQGYPEEPARLTPSGADAIRNHIYNNHESRYSLLKDVATVGQGKIKPIETLRGPYIYAYMPKVDEHYLWKLATGVVPADKDQSPKKKLFSIF